MSTYPLVVVKPISIGDSASFSRASPATYFDSDGILKTAAIDVPRIAYNPVTLVNEGLMRELDATNLLPYSAAFGTVGTVVAASISASTSTAPDGTSTATLFVPDSTTAEHRGYISFTNSALTYTFSRFLKYRGKRFAQFSWNAGQSGDYANFDLVNGAVTGGLNAGATIDPVGDDWYRCTITSELSAAAGAVFVYSVDSGSAGRQATSLGDSINGFDLWGHQLELGSFATSYIPTTTVPVTRYADVVSGSGLLASDVPETDYAAWSGATTYAAGARVILTSTHKIYESLQAGNLNKSPTSEALWWIEVSPTNRWALFDGGISTQTKQATYIKYTITPGEAVNAIAALNLTNATRIDVTITSASLGVVYQKTINMAFLPDSISWWDWFFGARRGQTQCILTDLPSYPDCTIVFELTGGAELAIGVLLVGQQRTFSVGIKYGAKVGIQDYSRKEKNDFGDTILVQRAFAKRADFDMMLEAGEIDALERFLTDVRAVPCLWIGNAQYEAMTVFGFYKTFDILISYPTCADCSLQIEGLT